MSQTYYQKHRDTIRARQAAYYQANKAHCIARQRAWRERNPTHRRAVALQTYGLSIADYDALLAAQGGGCAICGNNRGFANQQHLHVDHCHVSQQVRGILCGKCNVALGALNDSVEYLQRMITYLERHRASYCNSGPTNP